jgi:hypothetical protein
MVKNGDTSSKILVPELRQVLEKILAGLYHGTLTLIVQDGKILQIEKAEKIRVCDFALLNQQVHIKNKEINAALRAMKNSLQGMSYGQVTMIVKQGKITHLARTEKNRFDGFVGLDGDGI